MPLPKGVFKRSSKLVGLVGKVAKEELKNRLSGNSKAEWLATRVRQAEALRDTLGQLKGAAMKAGQLISLESVDFLPQEVLDVLSQLQNQAPEMDWSVLEETLKHELGPKFHDLKNINPKPLASASIGQVHEAEVGDRKVVLKIQYPQVKSSIASDLALIKQVTSSFLYATRRSVELDEAFNELKEVLLLETDYRNELANTQKAFMFCQNDSRYRVPEVIESYSSEKVLTMTHEQGIPLNTWMKFNHTAETKELFTQALLDLFFKEFTEWKMVQTDPNPGNFLVQQDPLKLVLLDFGACKFFDDQFLKEYARLLKLFMSKKSEDILYHSEKFGLISPRESQATKDIFVKMMKMSVEPFREDCQPFKFDDEKYIKESRAITREFLISLKHSPPPRRILFLHRKLVGIFQILKKINAQADLRPYWDRLTQTTT